MFEKLDKPSPRPAKGDQRTYSLSLTTRGISAFKLAGVGLGSLVAAQGGRVGAAVSLLSLVIHTLSHGCAKAE